MSRSWRRRGAAGDTYLERTADRLRGMSVQYTDVHDGEADAIERRLRTMSYGSPQPLAGRLEETP